MILMFVLVPAETDPLTKKRGGKWGAIWPSGAGGIEMVLALLAKVVAFHMWLPVIEVWKSCLQLAFSWPFLTISLEERVHAEFRNSLQVFLGVQGRCRCWSWCLRRSTCGAGCWGCFYRCFFGLVRSSWSLLSISARARVWCHRGGARAGGSNVGQRFDDLQNVRLAELLPNELADPLGLEQSKL